nr:uncharacterized protein LOC127315632 [Lolium perenne]
MADLPGASAGLQAPVISMAPSTSSAPLPIAPVRPPLALAPTGFFISYQMRGVHIKNIIPRTLELSSGSYTQWRNLLELTAAEYGGLDHLTEDTAPANPDVEWCTIDPILQRWIYGSISVELTDMIIDPSKTRGSSTIAQYCARIKTVADALCDVDQPPSNDTLVTVLTRGLNERHAIIAKILLAASGKITLDDARNMLLLDEMQSRATERVASQSALIALGRGASGGGYGGGYGGGGYGGGPGGGGPYYQPAFLPPAHPGGIDTFGSNYGQAFATFASPPNGAVPFPASVYAAPPSVLQSPYYGVPPPPPQHLLIPRHGQAFGQDPPPPLYQAPPLFTVSAMSQQQQPGPSSAPPSFDQATLIGALTDLSMGGQSGPWIADFGASAHLSATHGNFSSPRPVFNMHRL